MNKEPLFTLRESESYAITIKDIAINRITMGITIPAGTVFIIKENLKMEGAYVGVSQCRELPVTQVFKGEFIILDVINFIIL